eukprot:superscaffoldBa00002557_g14642
MRLQEDGLPPAASPEERQRHLWQQLLNSEAKLQSATQELQTVRTQQANEMKEVESYVAHIRGLLQQRECLTAGYERDNEQLRQELHHIRQQQESQSKELAEMLAQEDLGEMGLSSPSEQVAYLLVERATLLERLEAAERRLDSQSLPDNLREVHLQAHSEEISLERNERQRLERDLEEASSRLAMAHQDIRRLNNELDGTVHEVENLRKEVDKLKHCDMMKLQRAKEQNDRLDAENRALRERVRLLESEKNNLRDQLARNDTDQDVAAKEDPKDKCINSDPQSHLSGLSATEKDLIHKRCRAAMEDRLVQVKELERQLLRLRKEQEELEERNEELESLLGETQNASKEERHRHEGELEGLHRRIKSLEGELKKQDTQEKLLKNGEEVKANESYLQLLAQMERAHRRLQSEAEHYKDSNQTQEDLRENRLQVDQLQEQADRLTMELSSLQTAHNRLRDEMVSERLQTAELQAKLSNSLQEKLAAEEERQRLELEVQRLKGQIQWHQEQLSSTKEALSNNQKSELLTTHIECRLSPVERTKDECLDQLSCLKQELNHLQTKLGEERQLASQHQLALQAQINEAQARIKSQDLVMSQKSEEAKQMKQDLQRAQSLFTSAERELRYEKEKNMDLKRHNTLLDQEKLKLCAELKQVQTKLVQLEQSVHTQAADSERQQQRIRELELELARNSTNRSTTTSLQEDLQAERARLIAADKKVLELQQQLKSAQHQLRMEEARAGESSRLERDSRDLS